MAIHPEDSKIQVLEPKPLPRPVLSTEDSYMKYLGALGQETTVFCGCEIRHPPDFSIDLKQERYAEGLSEIPMSRDRRDQSQEPVTEPERRALQAALGALSWRATQSAPWLCASVSYLQGVSRRRVWMIWVNKLIRLQRSFNQTPVRFTAGIEKPVLLTYHDASYACRRDGSSQGGLLAMLVDQKVLQGKSSSCSPIAWQNHKLPRVCRSSTAAEIQTGSHSMDSHEFTKQILVERFNSEAVLLKEAEGALQRVPSTVVTDAANLYDSVTRVETSGLQLEEKRLALEVLSIRERAAATGTEFRWVDAYQQLADGLSKPFQYHAFLMAPQKGFISLLFDDSFMSAKRKRAWHRKQYERQSRSEAWFCQATPKREFDGCKFRVVCVAFQSTMLCDTAATGRKPCEAFGAEKENSCAIAPQGSVALALGLISLHCSVKH